MLVIIRELMVITTINGFIFVCFSETDAKALLKERQKKDNHNLSKSAQLCPLLIGGFLYLQIPDLKNFLVFLRLCLSSMLVCS